MQVPSVKQGYTLIEIMLAFFVIAILMSGAYFIFNTLQYNARKGKTETNLRLLQSQLELYNTKNDQYPKQLTDLVPREIPKLPKDGWDNDFYYKLTPGRKPPYQLYSYGPNGPGEGTPEERISLQK